MSKRKNSFLFESYQINHFKSGFQSVDHGSASYRVYVEECHVKDLKVPQLKKIATKKNVDVRDSNERGYYISVEMAPIVFRDQTQQDKQK